MSFTTQTLYQAAEHNTEQRKQECSGQSLLNGHAHGTAFRCPSFWTCPPVLQHWTEYTSETGSVSKRRLLFGMQYEGQSFGARWFNVLKSLLHSENADENPSLLGDKIQRFQSRKIFEVYNKITDIRQHNKYLLEYIILSTPSFGVEVKPSVPRRRFAACKRSLDLRGSRNLGKITGQFLAHSSTFPY